MNAVVFDLDDTLLRDDLTISDYSVHVFRRLHEKGFFLIAASGRSQYSMKPYVDGLGCLSGYISCNGAEIWDADHHLLHQVYFPAETAIEIAAFAEAHACYAQVYEKDCFYYNRHGVYADRYASATRLTGIHVGKLDEYIHEPRNKILMIDQDDRIADLYDTAVALFGDRASVTRSKPYYLEFNPPAAQKGTALLTIAERLGFRAEETIAFGDSLNDISLFQVCGASVSVANGWKEILPYCTDLCGSNNEDGPAHYLETRYLMEVSS